MTDKELKKLNKTELLWIIHDQEEEIIELKNKLKTFDDSEVEEKSEEQLEDNMSEEVTDDESW